MATDFVWSFSTSASLDTTAPTVISTDPADLAGTIGTNQKITATFSQGMDSISLTASTFALTGPGLTPVSGTVTYTTTGVSATFTPDSPLATGVLYTATITNGALDLAGNPLAVAKFTWTFTTGSGPDITAPTVTLTVPASGASPVFTNAAINSTFSKTMDPTTLNLATFRLVGPGPTPIAGKITYVTDQIATFTPTNALATGSTFTATVTTGARDLSGNGLAADFVWSFTTGSAVGLLPVDLGAATGFEVLASSTVTNTGATMLDGDLGVTPGTAATGFPPGLVNGTIELNTPPATAAGAALMNAFADAAGRMGASLTFENLAGHTLFPGLYTSAATSFEITGGTLTLDAQGDANAVWIFQMPASTLTLTTPACSVILVNGAQAANVFWQVGSSATIGADCVMRGNILASASITLAAGATLDGRALAGAAAGAVTLDTNSVSAGGACSQ